MLGIYMIIIYLLFLSPVFLWTYCMMYVFGRTDFYDKLIFTIVNMVYVMGLYLSTPEEFRKIF